MSWWKNIFLSTKSIDSMVAGVINTGDALFYTEEEKAQSRADTREWYIKLISSMTPYNVAMRVLAFAVASVWVVHLIASSTLYGAAIIICGVDAEVCRTALAAKAIDSQLTQHINEPFYMVMMFYFGAAGVNGAIRTWKDKP